MSKTKKQSVNFTKKLEKADAAMTAKKEGKKCSY